MEQRTDGLDKNVQCRRCGYNLRGLASHSNCPECNEPVVGSLFALRDRSIPVSAVDLDRIRSGFRLLIFDAVAVVGLFMVGLVTAQLASYEVTLVGLAFMGCLPLAILLAVVALARCAPRAYAVGPAVVLAVLLAARFVLHASGVLSYTAPCMVVGTSIVWAATAGGFLRGLAPLARMMKVEGLAPNSGQAWFVFLVLSAGAGGLSLTGRPTLYSAQGLPFVANLLILAVTLWLLLKYHKRLGNAVPLESLPCSSVLNGGETPPPA